MQVKKYPWNELLSYPCLSNFARNLLEKESRNRKKQRWENLVYWNNYQTIEDYEVKTNSVRNPELNETSQKG